MARKDKISLSTLALAKDYTDTHGGGGGGGTSNYNDLSHHPKINNVELVGNKSLEDLGIQAELTIDTALSKTSSNPVQNKTIALPIEQLQGSMATAKSNIDLLSGSQDALRLAIQNLDLLVASKVDKEAGKGLSTNDFTDALKDKVVELPPIKVIGSGLNLDNNGKLSATGTVAVDSALSNTSENPVQNKVITLTIEQLQGSLADKANTSSLKDLAYVSKDGNASTKYLKGSGEWQTLDTTPTQSGTNAMTSGGVYTALSGKADSTDLDEWVTTTGTDGKVQSDNTVTFSGIDDTTSYGYDLYCDGKLITITNLAITGAGTSSMTLVYTVSGAATNDTCKLRRVK